MSYLPMDELVSSWDDLGDIPVDDDGYILEPFRHFPCGTFREDIWRWFEASNPKFSVAAMMFGTA